MKYAGVIVDISSASLDKIFQYSIPAELLGVIEIGSRVKIPFNKKIRTGYVIEIKDEPDIEVSRIKPVNDVISDSVSIDGRLIKLADWIRVHYGGTMIQALMTVVPVKKRIRPIEKKTVKLLISNEEAAHYAREALGRKHTAQSGLLELLAASTSMDYGTLTREFGISADTIKRIEKKGWIEINSTVLMRNAISVPQYYNKTEKLVLNDEQRYTADSIAAEMDAGDNTVCLIKGITGSGKTEVYMELIEHAMDKGKDVICLIPEISLTYQTVIRFYKRFGDKISVINSRMSMGERYDSFHMAKEGKIKIMIGPRSALFTPFKNLGLIIIDEEHENAYKSESVPRYHVRETAIKLAELTSAKVVLGSATPSMESYYRAKNNEYRLYTLEHRTGNSTLPHVETVDLRDEMKKGNRSVFSRRLYEQISSCLKKNEQIMLFINRRGYMGFINCRDCGYVLQCPHCAVSLTQHKNNRLTCHYCGYETQETRICPQCGSRHIGRFNAGTERIEEETKKFFPDARILRMDADTTKGKEGHSQILEKFALHKADILIGTQMIVKGHDYPNVTLVGVILADIALHSSDYMSSERCFQLLTQAAGRAGRGEQPGNVIIQTYDPGHYSIVHACTHDYDAFYEDELEYRKLMDYPPVTRFMNCRIASDNEQFAIDISIAIKDLIKSGQYDVKIIGPGDAPLYKINDIFYRMVYFKSRSGRVLGMIKDDIDRFVKNHDDIKEKFQIQYDFR